MSTRRDNLTHDQYIMNAALGLAGEAGEVADHVKKWQFQGHDFDRVEVVKELGDILWYVALMCETVSVPMSTVMELNINKLRKRFPDGFQEARSLEREEYTNDRIYGAGEVLHSLSEARPRAGESG